eukprot:IDg6507t1
MIGKIAQRGQCMSSIRPCEIASGSTDVSKSGTSRVDAHEGSGSLRTKTRNGHCRDMGQSGAESLAEDIKIIVESLHRGKEKRERSVQY